MASDTLAQVIQCLKKLPNTRTDEVSISVVCCVKYKLFFCFVTFSMAHSHPDSRANLGIAICFNFARTSRSPVLSPIRKVAYILLLDLPRSYQFDYRSPCQQLKTSNDITMTAIGKGYLFDIQCTCPYCP